MGFIQMKGEIVSECSTMGQDDAGVFSLSSTVEIVEVMIVDSIFAKNYFNLFNTELVSFYAVGSTFSNTPLEEILGAKELNEKVYSFIPAEFLVAFKQDLTQTISDHVSD